ncbi:MAG: hypothetical protein QMD14_01155 [Candidatus Aenigmarchaeota archaeon]|nr:hypothetical protein [Candidatus Aenigmarchaeota archaeon]
MVKRVVTKRGFIAGFPVAYVAVLAAISVLASFIPAFPIVGLGGFISASLIMVALMGIFLGPVAGVVGIAIAGVITPLVAPYAAPFGFLTALCGITGALIAGLYAFKRWELGVIIQLILLGIWFGVASIYWASLELAYVGWYFPYLLIVSLIICLILRGRIHDWIVSLDQKKMIFGMFFAALAGVLGDHIIGCLLFVIMFAGPPAAFAAVATFYWAERIIVAIIAALIGASVLVGTRKIGIKLGPKP